MSIGNKSQYQNERGDKDTKFLSFALKPGQTTRLAVVACLVSGLAAGEVGAFQSTQNVEAGTRFDEIQRKYPKLPEKPFGKGIFAHVRKASGRTSESIKQITAWAENPYIAGTQLSYTWAELEPKENQYRWDIIERDMEPWAMAGKKCWIEISTAQWRDKTGTRVSPAWIFDRGVAKVHAEGTATYPVFWDDKYLELWGRFVRAFARRFDGDPRIEFVSTGGYSSGHEPRLSSRDNDALTDQWKRYGFDGFTASGVYLNRAIKPILKMFSDALQKTPVAQTINVRTELGEAINTYAASLKFILLSNGLSLRNANAASRQEWRNRREKLGVKMGFAEWGPAGRETDLKRLRERRERRRAAREEKELEKINKGRDRSSVATLIDVYRAAVGDNGDPKLWPRSRLSYLPLGERFPEVETEEEWKAALKWASEHLEG